MNKKDRANLLLIILTLYLILTLPVQVEALASPPAVSAKAAVLMEQQSGRLLYSKAAEQRMFPASLTKMLTALVILEYGGNLDQTVAVGEELWRVKPGSSTAGLLPGDRISLRNLLYAMLLPSGNDAAYTAAVHTARVHAADNTMPVEQALKHFRALMNQEARELGATNSNFINPDGYHDEQHYSTASDLALIAREVLQHEFLREVVKQAHVTIEYRSQGRQIRRNYQNTNRLVNPDDPLYYPLATGLKTGTTSLAGPCLATSAGADGLELIAVVLNSDYTGRWQDAIDLLDYGFHTYQYFELCQAGQAKESVWLYSRIPGFQAEGTLFCQESAGVVIARSDVNSLESSVVWDQSLVHLGSQGVAVSHATAPGTVVGQLRFTLHEEELATIALVLGSEHGKYRPSRALVLMLASVLITTGVIICLRLHCRLRAAK